MTYRCLDVNNSNTVSLFSAIPWDINVYCPECPPMGTIGHMGEQHKSFCHSCHERGPSCI